MDSEIQYNNWLAFHYLKLDEKSATFKVKLQIIHQVFQKNINDFVDELLILVLVLMIIINCYKRIFSLKLVETNLFVTMIHLSQAQPIVAVLETYKTDSTDD